jgi:diaminopimelate epimerase
MNNGFTFYKYQGAGNDFVILDNRLTNSFDFHQPGFVAHLCHRNFGVGADGLILLEEDSYTDFYMRYFNSDGKEGSMCGNGGRCIVAFARDLNLIKDEGSFNASDGIHHFKVLENNLYAISLNDVSSIEIKENGYFMNTGSPHWVTFVPELTGLDVYHEGKKIRFDPVFGHGGTNVNFLVDSENGLEVATFERGVERETLACGTGVAAAAIAYYISKGWQVDAFEVNLKTKGGELQVEFKPNHEKEIPSFSDIRLTGPAIQVFKGFFNL